MKKIFLVVVVGLVVISCGDSNKTKTDEVQYLSFEDKNIGSDEWKLEEIKSIKADSATIHDVDYKDVANGTNQRMSNAIDFYQVIAPHGVDIGKLMMILFKR